jgi:hypothetical protein
MDSPAAKGIYLVGDISLPPVTFERAGTSIAPASWCWRSRPIRWPRSSSNRPRLSPTPRPIGELFDRIEHLTQAGRLEPKTKDVDAPATGGITIDGVELALNGESNGTVYADIKNKLGRDKFAGHAKMAEAAGGRYIKTSRASSSRPPRRGRSSSNRSPTRRRRRRPRPSAPSGVTFKTGETIHGKTGAKVFVAVPDQRVERDVYNQMATAAKAFGGYYSSYNKQGAIPGFQFKSAEERQKFLDAMGGKGGGPDGPGLADADTDASPDAGLHEARGQAAGT